VLRFKPALPRRWKALSFRAVQNGQWVSVRISHKGVRLEADEANTKACPVTVGGATRALKAGELWSPAPARHKAG
jgi:trehalose/maltose hydrolase-like predicted phosphorylase